MMSPVMIGALVATPLILRILTVAPIAGYAEASPRCRTTRAWTPTCAAATRIASCARTAS